MIESLKKLRLLPPPCNELLPLLTMILSFATVSFIADGDLLALRGERISKIMATTSEENIFVLGSFFIYMVVYWGYSLLIHAAEHAFTETLSHFKIQPDVPVASWAEVGKMAPLVLFNQLAFGMPMLKVLYVLLARRRGIDMLDIPSSPKFAGTMLLHVLCTEVWFYAVHRTLHAPFFYKHIHAVHHRYKAPSCLESVYVHPVEYVLNSFAVCVVGPAISGAPVLVTFLWIGLVTFLQVHDHSGYWFPFLPRVLMHDYHHQQIRCCYGILGLLDGIFGTNGDFRQYVEEQEDDSTCSENPKKSK